MSKLIEFATRHLLPILDRIAPTWSQGLRVNFAVKSERGRRPRPFSLWTGMHMGPPREGATAATAKALPPHAPAAVKSAIPIAAAPFSAAGYVSWAGLADRRYTGRHLPPAPEDYAAGLPSPEEVVRTLFLRQKGEFTPCKKTSALFCFFAQWFTDSFLRTDPIDRRRNTSNHEIDYCQIYGLDERTAFALRSGSAGACGWRMATCRA